MGEAIEERCGHPSLLENRCPDSEALVGCDVDVDAGAPVKPVQVVDEPPAARHVIHRLRNSPLRRPLDSSSTLPETNLSVRK